MWRGAAMQAMDFEKENGRPALWTNRMFSGMPNYLIYFKPVGNFIHYYPDDTTKRAVTYYKEGGKIAYAKLYHQLTGKLMAQGKYMDELKENDKGLVCIGKPESELRKDKFYDDYYKVKESLPKIKDPIERTINYEKIMKTIEKKYEIESKESLRNRIYKIINFIKKTNKKKILIVSHGSYIGYFLQCLFRVNRVKYTFNGVENCHISLLRYDNNKFNLLYGPSTEHFNLYG
jgi:broad specificity phosphatase PhoE